MSCNFKIEYTNKSADYIKVAERSINKAGGTFEGDSKGGDFHIPTPLGKIEGKFTVKAGFIDIEISKKPFLVSCARIEKELQKYAGQ